MLVFWGFCLDKVALIIENLGGFPLGAPFALAPRIGNKIEGNGVSGKISNKTK